MAERVCGFQLFLAIIAILDLLFRENEIRPCRINLLSKEGIRRRVCFYCCKVTTKLSDQFPIYCLVYGHVEHFSFVNFIFA